MTTSRAQPCASTSTAPSPSCPTPAYDTIHDSVGGWIEAAPTDGSITIWVNEEGKLGPLPFNPLGHALWAHVDTYGCIAAGDWMAGPCVVTGPARRRRARPPTSPTGCCPPSPTSPPPPASTSRATCGPVTSPPAPRARANGAAGRRGCSTPTRTAGPPVLHRQPTGPTRHPLRGLHQSPRSPAGDGSNVTSPPPGRAGRRHDDPAAQPRLPIGPLEAWLNARYANTSASADEQLGGRLSARRIGELIGYHDNPTLGPGRRAALASRRRPPLQRRPRRRTRRRSPRRGVARLPHHPSLSDVDHLPASPPTPATNSTPSPAKVPRPSTSPTPTPHASTTPSASPPTSDGTSTRPTCSPGSTPPLTATTNSPGRLAVLAEIARAARPRRPRRHLDLTTRHRRRDRVEALARRCRPDGRGTCATPVGGRQAPPSSGPSPPG